MSNGGYFTRTEIFEGPESAAKTLAHREDFVKIADKVVSDGINYFHFLGAGTSLHAGIAGSYAVRGIAGRPAFVAYSSEFPYDYAGVLSASDLVIALSQSGESTDTIKAVRLAKQRRTKVLGITSSPESTLAKISDYLLLARTTEEKSVMATKTYIAQLAAVFGLSVALAKSQRKITKHFFEKLWSELSSSPKLMRKTLESVESGVLEASKDLKFTRDVFVLSSGPNIASARETALKLKEGSGVHSEAYSAAEFRHGPITLVDNTVAIIGIVPPPNSAAHRPVTEIVTEARSKKATVLTAHTIEDRESGEMSDHSFVVPLMNEYLSPLVTILPFQLLSYHVAVRKGLNPDKPRGLVKVVREE